MSTLGTRRFAFMWATSSTMPGTWSMRPVMSRSHSGSPPPGGGVHASGATGVSGSLRSWCPRRRTRTSAAPYSSMVPSSFMRNCVFWSREYIGNDWHVAIWLGGVLSLHVDISGR